MNVVKQLVADYGVDPAAKIEVKPYSSWVAVMFQCDTVYRMAHKRYTLLLWVDIMK